MNHADHDITGLSDISRQALAFYDERLRHDLEPDQIGKGIAIHPATGDYEVAANPTVACHALRVKHPEGGLVTFRICLTPEPGLAARLMGSEGKPA
jgi:hypothetical protein